MCYLLHELSWLYINRISKLHILVLHVCFNYSLTLSIYIYFYSHSVPWITYSGNLNMAWERHYFPYFPFLSCSLNSSIKLFCCTGLTCVDMHLALQWNIYALILSHEKSNIKNRGQCIIQTENAHKRRRKV